MTLNNATFDREMGIPSVVVAETNEDDWQELLTLTRENNEILKRLDQTVVMVREIIAKAPTAVADAPPLLRPVLKMLFPDS